MILGFEILLSPGRTPGPVPIELEFNPASIQAVCSNGHSIINSSIWITFEGQKCHGGRLNTAILQSTKVPIKSYGAGTYEIEADGGHQNIGNYRMFGIFYSYESLLKDMSTTHLHDLAVNIDKELELR